MQVFYFLYLLLIFIYMENATNKIIGISLSPDIIKLLEDSNFNRSKLIDSLLTEHFKKTNKKIK
jgi:hypothetical protein